MESTSTSSYKCNGDMEKISKNLHRRSLSENDIHHLDPNPPILKVPTSDKQASWKKLLSILKLLRCFGLFPSLVPIQISKFSSVKSKFMLQFWRLLSICGILLSATLFAFNVYIINDSSTNIGVLHVNTVTSILTGLKPLEAIISLGVFTFGVNRHRKFLRELNAVFVSYQDYFGISPNTAASLNFALVLTFSAGAISCAARVLQYILVGEVPGESWFSDASILIVAILAIWQFLPLFYFVHVNRLLKFWFSGLDTQIKQDKKLVRYTIEFYYRRYLQLTDLCEAMGHFFNPFIFFGIGVSVATLCLTIHFLTHADLVLAIPEDSSFPERVITVFLSVWTGIQIFTAIVYIASISIAGQQTNEQARRIVDTILSLKANDENARFQIMLFLHKIQTQFIWGVTVWKTFPVERNLQFTLVGAIGSYTMILLRLQQTRWSCTLGDSLFLSYNHTTLTV